MRTTTFSTVASTLMLLAGGVAAAPAKGECGSVDTSIIAHTGTPVGAEIDLAGSTFASPPPTATTRPTKRTSDANRLTARVYVTKPDKSSSRAKNRKKAAVLYLTDVFGIDLVGNKLYVVPFFLENGRMFMRDADRTAVWPTASRARAT